MLTEKDSTSLFAFLVDDAIQAGRLQVKIGRLILDGTIVAPSVYHLGKEQMVELEDVLSGDGAERRVDNHMLVVYLGQLNAEIQEQGLKLSAHMKAEEDHQTKIKELIELLISFKGFIRIMKWVSAAVTSVVVTWFWLKDHFKF